jgi:D-sedoheptulose 7-phosphate isomerase
MTEAELFAAILYRSAELKRRIATELAVPVIATVDTCEASLRGGGELLFCGNGGPAGDSMHLATELLIRLRPHVERDSWPAISLTFDPTTVLAAGNETVDLVAELSFGREDQDRRADSCGAQPP